MRGRTREETVKEMGQAQAGQFGSHQVFDGNHASNATLLRKLAPYALGMLIALYEHKIFVEGVIWNLNSCDQWGGGIRQAACSRILPGLYADARVAGHDASTNALSITIAA